MFAECADRLFVSTPCLAVLMKVDTLAVVVIPSLVCIIYVREGATALSSTTMMAPIPS